MDITTVLRQDHAELLKTAVSMCTAEKPPQARQAYVELKDMLELHARAEEAVVYSALDRMGREILREATRLGEVEHGLCDHLVNCLKKGRADSILWKARATVLLELLDHHIDEEHQRLLPLLDQHFDVEQRVAMGVRFEQRKTATMNM